MWYIIGVAYIIALAFVWAACKLAKESDEMITDSFMPTEMITRAKAQEIVNEWHAQGGVA